MPDRLKRLLALPLAILILGYDALDAVLGPLVRPAIAWAASLTLFRRIGDAIARLPPYGALALLAVPFALIEPFKFVALYWLAEGHVALGATTLVAAHLSSLFICERIFHAGKARLLEIGWFARGYGVVVRVRSWSMAWLRSTSAYRAVADLATRLRASLRRASSG